MMKKISMFCLWLLLIIGLLITSEVFARLLQKYIVFSFTLRKPSFNQLDQLRIYNKTAFANNPHFFDGWKFQPTFFESDSPFPYYRYKPNQKLANQKGVLIPVEGNVEAFYSINSLGFKSKEIRPEKPKGTIRIVALGASTTEGSSSNENTYPAQLEEILKQKGFQVEVINAGHGGYRVDDILSLFKSVILPIKPDIVIFYEGSMNNFKFNEWLGNDWHGENTWFRAYPGCIQNLFTHSALFIWFSEKIGIPSPKLEYSHLFDTTQPKPSLKHYQNQVKEIIRLSKENSITPVLATFITVAHEGLTITADQPEIWKSVTLRLFPLTFGEVKQMHDAYNEIIRGIAVEEQILLIDIASVFPQDTKYFLDYVHLNPEGDKLLATILAGVLEKQIADNLPQ